MDSSTLYRVSDFDPFLFLPTYFECLPVFVSSAKFRHLTLALFEKSLIISDQIMKGVESLFY